MFTISGLGLIGVSIASQREAPFVPKDAANGSSSYKRARKGVTTTIPIPKAPSSVTTRLSERTLARSKPTTLDIPSIDVHSVIQHLGQTPEGALETPAAGPHYNEAAWYRYSPTPGSLGPAILLGHVDSAAEGPSVFFRLGELSKGDRVSVTRADGSVAAFTVDAVHRYSKEDFPTQLVYGDIAHAGLRLLTCGGDFDDTTGHYLDNVVVFASLVR
ncbi:MAG: hypothetical protein QOH90_1353 [Actinomycetota bacterium]|nr:hypothetical protein [Actinomycetota bacterium]